MTITFQDSLLKYLFQHKEAKQYRTCLDSDMFDVHEVKFIYSLWEDYIDKYNAVPTKPAFLEYTDRAVKTIRGGITHEKYSVILDAIAKAFSPDSAEEHEFTKDIIVEYARRKGVRNLMTSRADKIKNATTADLDDMFTEFRRIVSIGAGTEEALKNRGGSLFNDTDTRISDSVSEGHPTFLGALNRMTAAGGFYTPQHILLVGGPKAFKTGTMICLAVEYARSGLKVLYVDAENGLNSIKTRLRQCLLECERSEVNMYKRELVNIMTRIKKFGGDIHTHQCPAGSTLDDVDAELARLAAEEDYHPNVIFYDPLYKFQPVNKRIFDDNKKIQDLNAHAGKLNVKYDMFSITAAKIKADAINKLVIKKNDLGVDFAQNYDAHAVFGLCRTETEEANGFGRIVPISQREGISYRPGAMATCAIRINESTNTITELDAEAYLATLEEEHTPKHTGRPKRYIPPSSIKDD